MPKRRKKHTPAILVIIAIIAILIPHAQVIVALAFLALAGVITRGIYVHYAILREQRFRREILVNPDPPGQYNSRYIPNEVKIVVSQRDGGRCRKCLSTEDLQYDHIIPWSRGGANTVDNIQLLCGPCNRGKSDKFQ